MRLGLDEELAALPAAEAGAHLERLVDGNRLHVAHGELAGERGLAEHPDHEAGHVVERGGDDAAVGPSRRTFEALRNTTSRPPRRLRSAPRRRRSWDWSLRLRPDRRTPIPRSSPGTTARLPAVWPRMSAIRSRGAAPSSCSVREVAAEAITPSSASSGSCAANAWMRSRSAAAAAARASSEDMAGSVRSGPLLSS